MNNVTRAALTPIVLTLLWLVTVTPAFAGVSTDPLDRRLAVQVRFQDQGLADAMDFLSTATDAKIFMDWNSLSSISIKEKTPVSFIFSTRMNLSDALETITGGLGNIAAVKGSKGKPAFYSDGKLIIFTTDQAISRYKDFDKNHPIPDEAKATAKDESDQVVAPRANFSREFMKLPQIKTLDNCFARISKDTGVPLKIDWEAMARAGLGKDSKASLQMPTMPTDAKIPDASLIREELKIALVEFSNHERRLDYETTADGGVSIKVTHLQ